MNSNKGLAFEIVAVILLTVGRTVANDIGVVVWLGSRPSRPFGYDQFTEILRGLYLAGFVMLIVAMRGESFKEIGLSRPRWGKDIVLGVLLVFLTAILWTPFVLFFKLLSPLYFHQIRESVPGPSSISDYVWLLLATAMAGFAEELLTRGYLISRLRRLIASWKSVVISATIFSVWHISQGLFGVAHTFIWGLLYGYVFTRVGRVWPLALAHALNNIVFELVAD